MGAALDEAGTDRIRRALVGAGLLLMVSLGLSLAVALEKVDVTFSERGTHASEAQAWHRFAGWVFVLAGLGYAIVWAVAPLEYTSGLSMLVVAGCLVVVATKFLRHATARARPEPPAKL